jgi:hypothetical protein
MEISPAAGKILGMLMAYAVSALGLLLAYYNYRKRILRADPVFSKTAQRVIAAVTAAAVALVILAAAAMGDGETRGWEAIRSNLVGVVVPVLIFSLSFWLTWLLYRHFSRSQD